MTSPLRTLVILGAGGDLTSRLLLPGIGQYLASGRGEPVQLIGVGVDGMTDVAWRERVAASFSSGGAVGPLVDAVASETTFLQADVTATADLTRILRACTGEPALYFALPPAVTVAACAALAKVDLPDGTVFALEKPFGTDVRSARRLNRTLTALIAEDRIHRVDHFLGKSTVLNILGLRFANRVFEPLWSSQHVEKVDIVFDEPLGLEGRAGYYDNAGAMIDMIQSHLLLVMSLVVMETPPSIRADDLRSAMSQALRATRVWDDDAASSSRRARYTAGTIDGRHFPSYADEPGVDASRQTETLAEVTFAVDNWRWAGVPFTLRSGKALSGMRKEIIVTFREVPYLPKGLKGPRHPNRLRIALTPDELELDVMINGEGDPFSLDRITLRTEFAKGDVGPYGEVIAGILGDDPTLSVRGDAVEELWRIVTPVVKAWAADSVPLEQYRAGTAGPKGWRS